MRSIEKRVTKQKCERLEENGSEGRVVGRVRKEQGCKILKENKNHRGNEREDEK